MISSFIRGITSYLAAISFIRRNGLSIYYLYSGIIGILILAGLWFLTSTYSGDISQLIVSSFNLEETWFSKVSSWIVGGIMGISFLIVFKYLVLIVTSPIMSHLSERIESIMSDDYISLPFTVRGVLTDLSRSLRLSMRNIIKEVGITLALIFVGLFPIFTIASTPLIFLVQAYFAGFGNLDFYAERRYNLSQTIDFVGSNRGFAAGNGVVYMLLLAIPVVGVFFAPVLGTTSATIQAIDILDR